MAPLKIGADCIVGAGAVVINDASEGKIYVGNPGKALLDKKYKIIYFNGRSNMTNLDTSTPDLAVDETLNISMYTPENKALWDNYVSKAKNGHFLFYRDYMEYHSDRFIDYSFMFFKNKKIVGLFPANLVNEALHSHAGLTFGGVISDYDMSQSLMLQIFDKIVEHCKDKHITKIIYKAIPHIYQSIPADEDLYALFCLGAKVIGRNVSSSIYLPEKRKFNRYRLRAIRLAQKNNLYVTRSFDFKGYMSLAQEVIEGRHGVKPVHSANEMELLANRFPENIKLFASYKSDKMLAGIIVYENKNVAHCQYGANSVEGRRVGAEDLIIDFLVNDYYKDKKYFDFGISTENLGQFLNRGLTAYKEGFTASAVMYDLYRLEL